VIVAFVGKDGGRQGGEKNCRSHTPRILRATAK
jgi:hypothetical protein